IAAGGTLKTYPPTVIGSEGASGVAAGPGQRGQRMKATHPTSTTSTAGTPNANHMPPALRMRTALATLGAIGLVPVDHPASESFAAHGLESPREYATRRGAWPPQGVGSRHVHLPCLKNILARTAGGVKRGAHGAAFAWCVEASCRPNPFSRSFCLRSASRWQGCCQAVISSPPADRRASPCCFAGHAPRCWPPIHFLSLPLP